MPDNAFPITLVGQNWYSNSDEKRPIEAIVSEAYREARQTFISELSPDERKKLGLDTECTIDDVLKVINEKKAQYEARHTSDARKWLKVFSSRIAHYGAILDVFVQHHPEYVSLAWGTMKFLFMSIVEHEEKSKQICKAVVEIAIILPRADILLDLYRTPRMLEVMARLYAKIMQFLMKVIKWYKRPPIKHAIDAVFKPWPLSYKDIKDEIMELSGQVDDLASVGSKTETRNLHLVALRTEQNVKRQAQNQLEALQALPPTILESLTPMLQQILASVTEIKCLQHQGMSSQTEFFSENKRNHIMSGCFTELPTSGDSLEYCRSVQDKRRIKPQLQIPEIATLENWASNPSLTMLVIKSSSIETGRDFLVDLINLIKTSKIPILWALRYPGYWKSTITCIEILRMLVVQAIQVNPGALQGPTPIDMVNLREASGEVEWLQILARAVEGLQQIFIVIDADILGLATEHSKTRATKWLEIFTKKLSKTGVKILISSRNIDENYVATQWNAGCWSMLQTDNLNGKRIMQQTLNRRPRKKRRKTRW